MKAYLRAWEGYLKKDPLKKECYCTFQKQPSEVFYKKDVLRYFTEFTGKHLCQSFFFNKVAGLRLTTLLKKRLWYRCFPVNFVKFLRTRFLQNTSGRLLLTLVPPSGLGLGLQLVSSRVSSWWVINNKRAGGEGVVGEVRMCNNTKVKWCQTKDKCNFFQCIPSLLLYV